MTELRDAIYGLAVGDALGVPAEFQARGQYRIDDMVGGGIHRQPAGTWSDDTSMTLATADSIRRNNGKVDVSDIESCFKDWLYTGKYAIDGNVFDVGTTVATALDQGFGCAGEHSNGNGSLMRSSSRLFFMRSKAVVALFVRIILVMFVPSSLQRIPYHA